MLPCGWIIGWLVCWSIQQVWISGPDEGDSAASKGLLLFGQHSLQINVILLLFWASVPRQREPRDIYGHRHCAHQYVTSNHGQCGLLHGAHLTEQIPLPGRSIFVARMIMRSTPRSLAPTLSYHQNPRACSMYGFICRGDRPYIRSTGICSASSA